MPEPDFQGTQTSWTRLESPVGSIHVTLVGRSIVRLSFPDIDKALVPECPAIECPEDLRKSIESFFSQGPLFLPYKLEPRGTLFQQEVWMTLKKIPRGETLTYGQVAKRINRPNSARAVGAACGANPIPLLIPCHRVVSATGAGGFSLGLKLKIKLCEFESIHL